MKDQWTLKNISVVADMEHKKEMTNIIHRYTVIVIQNKKCLQLKFYIRYIIVETHNFLLFNIEFREETAQR